MVLWLLSCCLLLCIPPQTLKNFCLPFWCRQVDSRQSDQINPKLAYIYSKSREKRRRAFMCVGNSVSSNCFCLCTIFAMKFVTWINSKTGTAPPAAKQAFRVFRKLQVHCTVYARVKNVRNSHRRTSHGEREQGIKSCWNLNSCLQFVIKNPAR